MAPSAKKSRPTAKKASSSAKKAPRPSPVRSGTVAVVGRPNVGKSTLLNSLVGADLAIVSQKPETTRDSIRGIVTKAGVQFVYIDTPGISRVRTKLGAHMQAAARDTLEAAHVVLFVTEALREPKAKAADAAILRELPKNVPVLCVLNKVDLVKPRSDLFPILTDISAAFPFAAVIPVAARRSDGVERIEKEVLSHLPEQEAQFAEDEMTDRPLRFFVAEYIREQILRQTHEEVPHGVAVTVESYEEGKKAHRIVVTIHVDKDSHKPILLGKGGEKMKQMATTARERFEALSGQHVHLDVHIRVTPNWYQKADRLSEFGYTSGTS